MIRAWITAGLLLAVANAQAHHSYTEFDDEQIVEIEGTLVSAAWRNPHAMLEVQARDGSNRLATWEIETSPVNRFRRLQVPIEIFEVGSVVKIAGWPSKRSATRMYGTNILSADGQEAVLWQSRLRWNDTAYGTQRPTPDSSAVVSDEPTIFRVWSSGYAIPNQPDDPDASPRSLWRTALPLTDAARRAVASFDPVAQTTTPGCTPKGMPAIMSQPTPMEFVEQGDVILLRVEEYDTVRTIHMGNAARSADQPRTPLGYSTGRWDGDALVVSTAAVSARYLTNNGVPLGASATFVERFNPSKDGTRLHYTVTVTDPDYLTVPVELKRSWLATPGAQVLPFNCVE